MVGFEGGGASFAQKCFGLTRDAAADRCDWIGTVVLPGAPSSRRGTDVTSTTGGLGDSLDPTDPLNSACNIFLKRGGGEDNTTTKEDDDHGGVAVVLCGYRVPPRQADAWAKALLGAVDAEVVVALATVRVEPGRSEGWQGARLVATAEAEEREDCLKVMERYTSGLTCFSVVAFL